MQEKAQQENQQANQTIYGENHDGSTWAKAESLPPPPFQLKISPANRSAAIQQKSDGKLTKTPYTLEPGVQAPIQRNSHHDGCGCNACKGNSLQLKLDNASQRQPIQQKGFSLGCTCDACTGIQLKKSADANRPIQRSGNGVVQFRLPTFQSLRADYRNASLGITEAVMRDRVGSLLTRMRQEGRMTSSDPIPDILNRIFTPPGDMNEAAFNAAIDTSSANSVYRNVLDTETEVRNRDRPRLKRYIRQAIDITGRAQRSPTILRQIFGTKSGEAATVYQGAGAWLQRLHDDDAMMSSLVTTDYNEDDEETNSGGYVSRNRAGTVVAVHFSNDTVMISDWKNTILTLIHEACHFADSSVTDKGYYPPQTNQNAWVAYSEADKITNAAHFEEFPRRWLNRSLFANGTVFTPGVTVSGAPLSREDRAKQQASEYFRRNWANALTIHEDLRRILQEIRRGSTANFTRQKSRIIDVSRIFEMTVHTQTAANATLTDLDITISESIVRGTAFYGPQLRGTALTTTINTDADIPTAKDQLIRDTINARPILGNSARDIALQRFIRTNPSL